MSQGRRRRSGWALAASALAAVAAVSACDHTEPFVTAEQERTGPFSAAIPIRLTYADGSNIWPVLSENDEHLIYSYSRNFTSPEQDSCLAVLPAIGGTRIAEICPDVANDAQFRDGIEHGALSSDGTLVFTLHSGGLPPTNWTAIRGELQTASIDSVAGARSILGLRQRPSGAAGSWDYLLDMHWSGPGELLALAAQVDYRGPNIAKDTLYFGHTVVRLRVDQSPVEWSPVAGGFHASAMTVDAANGIIYLLNRYYADGINAEVVADTIFRVALTGGPAEVVYGTPDPTVPGQTGLIDIAAAEGRLFASRFSRVGSDVDWELVEVAANGISTVIPSNFPGPLGRIAVSRDASFVIAEVAGAGISLYRMVLP